MSGVQYWKALEDENTDAGPDQEKMGQQVEINIEGLAINSKTEECYDIIENLNHVIRNAGNDQEALSLVNNMLINISTIEKWDTVMQGNGMEDSPLRLSIKKNFYETFKVLLQFGKKELFAELLKLHGLGQFHLLKHCSRVTKLLQERHSEERSRCCSHHHADELLALMVDKVNFETVANALSVFNNKELEIENLIKMLTNFLKDPLSSIEQKTSNIRTFLLLLERGKYSQRSCARIIQADGDICSPLRIAIQERLRDICVVFLEKNSKIFKYALSYHSIPEIMSLMKIAGLEDIVIMTPASSCESSPKLAYGYMSSHSSMTDLSSPPGSPGYVGFGRLTVPYKIAGNNNSLFSSQVSDGSSSSRESSPAQLVRRIPVFYHHPYNHSQNSLLLGDGYPLDGMASVSKKRDDLDSRVSTTLERRHKRQREFMVDNSQFMPITEPLTRSLSEPSPGKGNNEKKPRFIL